MTMESFNNAIPVNFQKANHIMNDLRISLQKYLPSSHCFRDISFFIILLIDSLR